MRVALQQGGWLKQPMVHVHASNGPASPKLTALVTKLGGELMPYAGASQPLPLRHTYGTYQQFGGSHSDSLEQDAPP